MSNQQEIYSPVFNYEIPFEYLTVQTLIDELSKLEDKTLPVVIDFGKRSFMVEKLHAWRDDGGHPIEIGNAEEGPLGEISLVAGVELLEV